MDYWCCLMGICCAFGSPEQFKSLVDMRMKKGPPRNATDRASAEEAVRFDLDRVKDFLALVKGQK